MSQRMMQDIRLRLVILGLLVLLFVHCGSRPVDKEEIKGLKDYYKAHFLIGAALFPELFDDPISSELIKTHFSSITPENDMKWGLLHPNLGEYRFDRADKITEFAQAHGLKLIGHTLIWHSQLGKGVFIKGESEEQNRLVDRETLLMRMRAHIFTVSGRYKGRVHGWDVVNEALNEDGTFRESNFFRIAGDTFIEKAFEYAHEADPHAELYYNDYNLVIPAKRQGAIRIIKNLQEKGLKIDAVGIQAHWDLIFPSLEEIEKSIIQFSELGIMVMFTELDVSVLPSPWNMPSADVTIRHEKNENMNPYPDGIPDSVSEELARRYRDIFALFDKHKDKIGRVTFWGLHDGISWKNNFPVFGRTDYPLIFDRKMEPKKAYWELIRLVEEKTK